MGKQLIPEELDLLIQECLTDGILTPKERDVILRKAEKMGLDRDEIDIYLDAQVQKIDQANENAARRQERKSCPHCGAAVSVLIDKIRYLLFKLFMIDRLFEKIDIKVKSLIYKKPN